MKKNKKSGEIAFEEYYSDIFGERWPTLKASLLAGKPDFSYGEKLLHPYFMDEASVVAAKLLPTAGAEIIVDLCAAPGGKSLVLATVMDEGATLICNEKSMTRLRRLRSVLEEHLPQNTLSAVKTFCSDASLWFKKGESADRILLDAPCSSERHVLSSPEHLQAWTPSRVKSLAFTQKSLLFSAFLSLKPGGILLYSTCALSSSENDNIVASLLKKHENACVLPISADELSVPHENTSLGIHILPDFSHGRGPIYASRIKKRCNPS